MKIENPEDCHFQFPILTSGFIISCTNKKSPPAFYGQGFFFYKLNTGQKQDDLSFRRIP
ncbi:Uncharacterized protein dnm_084910 [Desulfonema magnum]|uniref:Uncharacterized protein n=1 Tax=Desulfonema magnum TaxID=45655 RepID=A0A975GSU3_9BACT|nr:Uncharacterized protein dnm_084910 [Desulfonema magnum]